MFKLIKITLASMTIIECRNTNLPSLSDRSGTRRNVSLMAGMTWSYMCRTSRQCSEKDESFNSSQCSNIKASRSTCNPGLVQLRLPAVWLPLPFVFSHCLCKTTTTVRTTWGAKKCIVWSVPEISVSMFSFICFEHPINNNNFPLCFCSHFVLFAIKKKKKLILKGKTCLCLNQTSLIHWQDDSHKAAHVPVFCVNSLVNNRMTCWPRNQIFKPLLSNTLQMKYYKIITSSSKRLHTSSEADLSSLEVMYWNILRKGHGSKGRGRVCVKSSQHKTLNRALKDTYIHVSRV